MQSVTKEKLESIIDGVYFINPGEVLGQQNVAAARHYETLGLTTICILVLKNGFKVTGESACVDPANYNKDTGQSIAYANAFEKLWALEGYLLKQQMFEQAEVAASLSQFGEEDCDGCKL